MESVEGSRPNVWQLQSRHDVQALILALQHPDPDVRKRAAVALRTLDASQAVPAFKAALRKETDESVRKSLFAALYILDHHTDVTTLVKTQDVSGLLEALKSRHPENVIAAAKALGELGDRMAVEPLIILFHNSAVPSKVRLAAAEALLQLKSAPAVVTLLGALRRDSWEVRRNAAAVLGQIQATWAVDPLIAALDDPQPVVRRTAAAALRRIGTVEAVAALRARFSSVSTGTFPAESAPPPAEPAQSMPAPSAPPVPMPVPAAAPSPSISAAPVPSLPAQTPALVKAPVLPQPAGESPNKLPEPVVPEAATRPMKPLTSPEVRDSASSEPVSRPTPPPERLSGVTLTVRKLITFFKPRGSEKT